MTRNNARRSYIVFVLPALHLVVSLFLWLRTASLEEHSWQWFPIFVVDFPFSLIPLFIGDMIFKKFGVTIHPMFLLGVTGTLWWYVLSVVFAWVIRLFRRPNVESVG